MLCRGLFRTGAMCLVLKPKLCQLFLFRSRMELKAMEEASFRVDTAVEAVERGSCNSC